VEDPGAVRLVERGGDIGGITQRLIERQRPARESRSERLPLDILHDEVFDVPFAAHVVNHADVGMIEARDGPRFALEPRTQSRIGEQVRQEDLDGDGPVQPRVAGLVDLPHPAGPERRDDLGWAETCTGRQWHRGSGSYA
jgi:hypothetical protein